MLHDLCYKQKSIVTLKETGQPKLRDSLQNFLLVPLESVKVVKDKEGLKNCQRLEETKRHDS